MSQEILNIILSAVGCIITGLMTWAVAALTKWINSKISDKQAANFFNRIIQIITDAVMSIYQQFVDTLKKEGKFDKAAQEQAKKAALTIIQSELTPELMNYIKENYGDVVPWLENQIEAILYQLKN